MVGLSRTVLCLAAALLGIALASCTDDGSDARDAAAKEQSATCRRLSEASADLSELPEQHEVDATAGSCRLTAGDVTLDLSKIPLDSVELQHGGDPVDALKPPISARWSTQGVASGGVLWVRKGDTAYRVGVSIPSDPQAERAAAVAIARRLVRDAKASSGGTTTAAEPVGRSRCPAEILGPIEDAIGEVEEVVTQDSETCTFRTPESALAIVRSAACQLPAPDIDAEGDEVAWEEVAPSSKGSGARLFVSTIGTGVRLCLDGARPWQIDVSGGGSTDVQTSVADAVGAELPRKR